MKTREISKEELSQYNFICEGYKAVNYDNSTHKDFSYAPKGESLIGRMYRVDGEIKECEWGLHFSKNPAYVFLFYEPLGYNRYFKIRAYDKVVDSVDGFKSVSNVIEFVEEYDLMQFIEIVKRFDRGSHAVRGSNAVSGSTAVSYSNAVINSQAVSYSHAVSDSNAVRGSTAVSYSTAVRGSNAVSNSQAVNYSHAVSGSNAVSNSQAVRGSTAVSYSNAVSDSTAVSCSHAVSDSDAVSGSTAVNGSCAVSYSYGLRECEAVKNAIFCYKIEGKKNVIFNKKCTKERFYEVYYKLKSFNWNPRFENWYDIKGNKKWWAFCFPELKEVSNKEAWSKMPSEMREYIESLPEYNEEIFKKITE